MADMLRPLLPRVRLQVGVTGHRLGPKLSLQSVAPIRATVDRVLATFAGAARDTVEKRGAGVIEKELELVVISPLAEGADRIVAEAGLAAGFALEVVLPFAREEYERDFETEESREVFAALFRKAGSVFELDGARSQANRAYEAVGLITLANSDLLIAIWDRNEASGVGGTALVVDRAINEGIPVVLIDPTEPGRATLLMADNPDLAPASLRHEELQRPDALAEIPGLVDTLIGPPPPGKSWLSLDAYLAEKERRRNFLPAYAFLVRIFAGRKLHQSDLKQPPYLENTRSQWEEYFKIVNRDDRLTEAIDQLLLPAFSMADNLSVYYARMFRGTYISLYVAAASVAMLGVLGIFLHNLPTLVFVFEILSLIIIGAVIVSWSIAKRVDVHRRWLEYRRLAECLRHMRLIALTASAGTLPRPGRSPDDDSSWVDWYARAMRRLLPLPRQRVDDKYLTMIKKAACDTELTGQINYHESNASLMRKLDHRLHAVGMWLFVTTAVLLILLLFINWPDMVWLKTTLTFLTIAFPLFGSAINAIHAQGDFITVSRRSRRTANRLLEIRKALSEEDLSFARVADRVEMASDMMMDDLVEWNLVFRTRPLSLPV